MGMKEAEITVGRTYTGKSWKGDRKVVQVVKERGLTVVHYIDLRTSRAGKAPLELFAVNADGPGLVSNT